MSRNSKKSNGQKRKRRRETMLHKSSFRFIRALLFANLKRGNGTPEDKGCKKSAPVSRDPLGTHGEVPSFPETPIDRCFRKHDSIVEECLMLL